MSKYSDTSSVALLGATSQIAKDLIQFLGTKADLRILLYVRDVASISRWLNEMALDMSCISVHDYADYGREPHDAVINFVGVGDPRRAIQMGASIFDLTQKFDDLVLGHLFSNPSRRYIFMSSGAVYGDSFSTPVNAESIARIPINSISPQHYYSIAKLYAEARHRSLNELAITDVRVFNYFSRSQDLNSRFLISDILRSIIDDAVMLTTEESVSRDFIHPIDFSHLIDCVLKSEPANRAVDVYSRVAVEKFELFEAMRTKFGLKYKIVPSSRQTTVNATGQKQKYYSTNKIAAELGFSPKYSALESVLLESAAILNHPLRELV